MRPERGKGLREGCPNLTYSLCVAEHLLSRALASIPNEGEGDGGPDAEDTYVRVADNQEKIVDRPWNRGREFR
ncbi:hypothetical protein LBMAG56_07690 [Verrucomicrobiota bacterium]|nr:hypothetical protein LBMAG56_07690 [Verrucomicrobiota bacterium]